MGKSCRIAAYKETSEVCFLFCKICEKYRANLMDEKKRLCKTHKNQCRKYAHYPMIIFAAWTYAFLVWSF